MLKIRQVALRWILPWIPPLLWGGIIFLFSSQPSLPSPDDIVLDFIIKKMAHIFVFGVFYVLVWVAVQQSFRLQHRQGRWLLPFIICILYAAVDEFHQSLTPGRSPTLRDVGYDSLGMLIAWSWLYRYV
jgi:VanZ family protein